MTNILATLIVITNTHWTTTRVEPSHMSCCVLNCRADHSEQQVQTASLERCWVVAVPFDGQTNRFTLKSEPIANPPQTRILYSGFDYVRDPQKATPNQWAIPNAIQFTNMNLGIVIGPTTTTPRFP